LDIDGFHLFLELNILREIIGLENDINHLTFLII